MSEPPAPRASMLIDNSAWSRSEHAAISPAFASRMRARSLVACPPFLIEARYSARSGVELRDVQAMIAAAMPSVPCTEETWELAFDAQQRMADAAGLMHRRKPIDFLIAATAHEHGLGVLHYDRDYDLIAQHSGLRFASVWIAEPGSLDA